MIANALGHPQHDYSLQEQIKIGLRVVEPGQKNVEMAKILKFKPSPGTPSTSYPSAPMFKEYLVKPHYEIFVGGENDIIKKIHTALICPQRPLYLGQSDDLVEIDTSEVVDVPQIKTNEFHTIVEGIYDNCFIERVPYEFHEGNGKYSLEYKTVSIPKILGHTVKKSGYAANFEGINTFLF